MISGNGYFNINVCNEILLLQVLYLYVDILIVQTVAFALYMNC